MKTNVTSNSLSIKLQCAFNSLYHTLVAHGLNRTARYINFKELFIGGKKKRNEKKSKNMDERIFDKIASLSSLLGWVIY